MPCTYKGHSDWLSLLKPAISVLLKGTLVMSDTENKPDQSPPQETKEEPMDTSEENPTEDKGAAGDGPSTSDSSKKGDSSTEDRGEPASSDEDSEKPSEENKARPDKGDGDALKSDIKDKTNDEKEDEDDEDDGDDDNDETEEGPAAEKEMPPKKSVKKPREDSVERDDEEPKLGLLEQPVIIQSGKRQKRKVERLEIAVSTPKETKLDIPEGSGVKLGDIAAVEYHLTKNLADDLKPLHRVLFGKVGTASTIKKNIRKFCGFTFTANSTEYKRKEQILNKMTQAVLKPICETLTLERGGSKEAIVTRIMEFLMKPQDTGKSVPQKRKRKSKGEAKRTKGKRKSRGEKDKKAKKTPKKKAKKEEESEEEEEEEESEEEEDSDNEDSNEESEEEQPKKKKAKIETKKPAKKVTKKKKEKSAEEVDESDDDEEEEEEEEEEASESEEEKPKEKKTSKKKKAPSDDEIKETVKKILDGANLEEVTMKTVCKQVYAKYPEFDLSHKKEFIKSTVKQIIR